MKYKKIIFILTSLFFLNGCFQSTALLGPAITGMTTGSMYEASLSYGAGSILKNQTGQSTVEYITQLLEPVNKEKNEKIKIDFIELVEKRVKLTRKKLFPEIN